MAPREPDIGVEVAFAGTDACILRALRLGAGATVRDALERSGIMRCLPAGNPNELKVGIYGRLVTLDTRLADGDRVEIYRPLVADPKDARRRRTT